LVEKGVELLELLVNVGTAQAVVDLESVYLTVDEAQILELLQMLGDGGSAQGQLLGDVARNAGFGFGQILEDGQSRRMGDYFGKLGELLELGAEFVGFGHVINCIEV
jgi:hypothetical protein